MANEQWVEVKTQWCEVAQSDVTMMERRVYAAATLPDTEPYRILGHRCSADVICNLLGCHCRWAYTDPAVDRFAIQRD